MWHRYWRVVRNATLLAALAAALAPAGASALQKGIWGPSSHGPADAFALYHRLGIKIYETTLDWNQVAVSRPRDPTSPSDPAYAWPAQLSQDIADAAHYGMRVLLEVGNAPAWANGGHAGMGWAPRDPRDYAQFIEAAAREYPRVHLWMIWGEPNRKGDFRPEVPARYSQTKLTAAQRRAPHLYAQMLNDAYGVLKRLSARNVVIGGNTYTAGLLDPQQWLANLVLPDGRPPRMSMYGHDPFSYTAPLFGAPPSSYGEVQFSDLPRLEAWTRTYLGHPVPLFLSSFCVPTAPNRTFNFYVSPPSVAARWVKDALVTAGHAGYIYALGWTSLRDSLPTDACGLIQQDGRRKPDFYAFANN